MASDIAGAFNEPLLLMRGVTRALIEWLYARMLRLLLG